MYIMLLGNRICSYYCSSFD